MAPFEIFNATHSWRNCADLRPWLIVELRTNKTLGCFPISGQCYSGNCFLIDINHPDFTATGLSKSSYVLDEVIFELEIDEFGKRRGELTNQLLQAFRNFAGL